MESKESNVKSKRDKSFYENYVCPSCFHQIHECTCESVNPSYNLILIDKGIQEHIRILNEKNYYTKFCCESHSKNDILYIMFSSALDDDVKAPNGFKKKWKKIIEYSYKKNISDEEFENEKKEHLETLLEWCNSLPYKAPFPSQFANNRTHGKQ